jgi:hypothetical protein
MLFSSSSTRRSASCGAHRCGDQQLIYEPASYLITQGKFIFDLWVLVSIIMGPISAAAAYTASGVDVLAAA